MKFLILGDVMGISGRKALKSKLPNLIINNDFSSWVNIRGRKPLERFVRNELNWSRVGT